MHFRRAFNITQLCNTQKKCTWRRVCSDRERERKQVRGRYCWSCRHEYRSAWRIRLSSLGFGQRPRQAAPKYATAFTFGIVCSLPSLCSSSSTWSTCTGLLLGNVQTQATIRLFFFFPEEVTTVDSTPNVTLLSHNYGQQQTCRAPCFTHSTWCTSLAACKQRLYKHDASETGK